jgi:hypothetical protein
MKEEGKTEIYELKNEEKSVKGKSRKGEEITVKKKKNKEKKWWPAVREEGTAAESEMEAAHGTGVFRSGGAVERGALG